jgi:hypothetical protein
VSGSVVRPCGGTWRRWWGIMVWWPPGCSGGLPTAPRGSNTARASQGPQVRWGCVRGVRGGHHKGGVRFVDELSNVVDGNTRIPVIEQELHGQVYCIRYWCHHSHKLQCLSFMVNFTCFHLYITLKSCFL